jgi:L-asparaginase/Glu-tRNA(Gln) amidotransferase subunit D
MEIGVLVTHGTDTLAWSLPFIRYALKNLPCNVCLTGSQVPMEKAFAWSDGFQNIHGAVRFLSMLEPPGVFAVFNNGTNAFSDSLAKVERWRGSAFIGDPIATMEWDEVQHRAGDARLREPVILDKLHLVTTGGTIDSAPPQDAAPGAALQPGASVVEEFLRLAMPEAFREIFVHPVLRIDSAELDRERLERIARAIFNCVADGAGLHAPAPTLDLGFADGVEILVCDPFRSARDYCEAVERARGVVLAGYGGGNANRDLSRPGNALEALRLARELGKPFVLSSQVPIGTADFVYETAAAFIREGAIPGVDLSLPECQVRLMVLLGHGSELDALAAETGESPERLLRLLFLSGMKFRNAASRQAYRRLAGDDLPLLREDLLVGAPLGELGPRLRQILELRGR